MVIVNPKQIEVQQFVITDATGRLINSFNFHTKDIIIKSTTQQLHPGIYFLKIIGSNDIKTIAFIKQ